MDALPHLFLMKNNKERHGNDAVIAGFVTIEIECKAIELDMDGMIFSIVIATISEFAKFNLRDILRRTK